MGAANTVVCDFRLVGSGYVTTLHRYGVAVWTYTVNDRELWDMLIRLGVDGIISDIPARLRGFMETAVEDE